MLKKRILSIGHNFALLRFRNAVIQNAGYQVTTTKETDLVVELAGKHNFAAVVICSSVPAYLRQTIASELKRLRPAIPLIIVCVDSEHDCLRGFAEEVVTVPASGSQQALVDAIARVAERPQEDQREII